MTVCIAARFKGGTVCASDSAITSGNNRVTLPHIKGQYLHDGFALFSGSLGVVQHIMGRAQDEHLHDVIRDEMDEFEDEDGFEFLLLSGRSMHILDHDGAAYAQEDYAAIGHGGDGARMLLKGMYVCEAEEYVTTTLHTIIQIIQEFDNTVYGPVRTAVFYD